MNLVAGLDERAGLTREATELASLQISPRSLCDLELLATGGFSPLSRFMDRAAYFSVLESMRLPDGTLFPIPITLPVSGTAGLGRRIALRSATNHLLAILEIEEVFERDPDLEARQVCGTSSEDHRLVAEMRSWGKYCLSGPLRIVELPRHHDFQDLRRTPAQVRQLLASIGNPKVVAFHTTTPLHRAAEEITKRAARDASGTLLIHPVVGLDQPGEVDHFTRVRIYKALVEEYYDRQTTLLSLLPLATRFAGARESVWHAIVRRNFGASHVIVDPDSGPDESHELLFRSSEEIGVIPVPYGELAYLPAEDRYEEVASLPAQSARFPVSARRLRHDYLAKSVPLPDWFARPEAAAILAETYPPRAQQGLCIWFTGLPSAGKSTIAEILATLLMEHGRRVTMLDGDVVRTHLSKGLGFSREDRDINIRRVGYVASEIARHHGIAICAAVSPFNSTRNQVRDMVGPDHFVLAYVSTPATVCEGRDVKGFYAKARAGELKNFTGVDDPYEPPPNPDILLETVDCTPEQNAQKVLEWLRRRGFVD